MIVGLPSGSGYGCWDGGGRGERWCGWCGLTWGWWWWWAEGSKRNRSFWWWCERWIWAGFNGGTKVGTVGSSSNGSRIENGGKLDDLLGGGVGTVGLGWALRRNLNKDSIDSLQFVYLFRLNFDCEGDCAFGGGVLRRLLRFWKTLGGGPKTSQERA